MKNNLIRQALYDLRHQSVIGTVTIIGTALSIFLIMVIVMMNRVNIIDFAPEVNRSRTLYGRNLNIGSLDGQSNSSARLSIEMARRLYGDLKSAELTSIMTTNDAMTVDVSAPGARTILAYHHATDDVFWEIYSFDFINGRPYDKAAFEAGVKEAVITENLARRLFQTADVVGREIQIRKSPYRVVGVVKDVSPLAKNSFADVYIPYTVDGSRHYSWGEQGFGPMQAVILARSEADFSAIKEEVLARMNVLDRELHQTGDSLIYHGQPYNQAESNYTSGSNQDSGEPEQRRIRWIIYAILLIVPAINLSSMTQSRLRRRVSEIGVRRAFGCTRAEVIRDVIAENFIITLIGGIAGLLLCLFFGYFFSDMVFFDINVQRQANLSLRLLFDWKLYASAILFCFILNLFSAGIPAWRASRISPVDAINSKNL